MEFTHSRIVKITAILLLLAAISQPIYTALYQFADGVDRRWLWGLEGLIFVLMAAFAGAAMTGSKRYALVFSAIAFSAVLNVIQVGVGLTQFGPFFKAVAAVPELQPAAGSVVAFSFFSYNAAKILLGLAAIVFGLDKLSRGNKALGGITALVGIVAFFANTGVMMFGRAGFVPSPVAGVSGVLAALLLAICLFTMTREDA